jgi:uncharacterized membrane protein
LIYPLAGLFLCAQPVVPQPRLLAQAGAARQNAARGKGLRPAIATSPNGPDDPTDPFITAEATALGNDPNQIFAFVRDQIRFEAYAGSVRGARGALWSMAGNTLDKASLLSALLQASGFQTRYVHYKLNDPSTLIRTMFPQTPVLLGCVPTTDFQADPGSNTFASNDSRDYYWVEYGPGNIDLDPNQAGAKPGQTIHAPDSNFTTVPQALRQQVTITINAELYSQAGALFGLGLATTPVLTQTFDASALVGNIVSAGNLVQSTSTGSLDISASTFTYTPYLLIGSGGADVSQDTIITGADFQELYTNFPLGNTILTGLFVEVDADDAWLYNQSAYTRTILDRIGPAGRQGYASVQVSLPATPAPAVTDYDIATIDILTSRQSLNTFQAQQTRLTNAYNNYEAVKPAFEAVPTTGNLTAAQQAVVQQAITLGKYLVIAENELIAMAYNGAADQLAGQLQTGYYMRIYPTAPRLTIAASALDSSGNAVYKLDVLKNDMRVTGGLGQASTAPYYEEVARGMTESTLEGPILSQATGIAATDISSVFGALGDPNLLTALGPPPNSQTPPDPGALTSTTLSADAQTLILDAVANGDDVITPTQMVTVNGITTVGWWETDQYGHTVSHFADGGHQAIAEYANLQEAVDKYNTKVAQFIGKVEGIGATGIAFATGILQGVATNAAFSSVLKSSKTAVAGVSSGGTLGSMATFLTNFSNNLKKLRDSVPRPDKQGISLLSSFGKGLDEGITFAQDWLKKNLPLDPEVLPFLNTPLGPLPAGVTPGNAPGVTASISVDPLSTMPFNGNELPVYLATITNTGPATDTFTLSSYDISGQFSVNPGSVAGSQYQSLTLLPGQVGQMNLCVFPNDPYGVNLPAVGTSHIFDLTVTGKTGGASTSQGAGYTMPAVPSLSISVDPPVLKVAPGGNLTATLTIGSVGNAATGPVTLGAVADSGIAVTALTSPVTVPLNGVATQPFTVTAGANTANNTYYVAVTASYTAAGGTQTVTFGVPVTVASLGTCALNTALTADQAGKTSLGNTLAHLANDMNAAAGAPANAALLSRIAGDLTVIQASLDAPYLQAFSASLAAAGAAVAGATPATLPAALSNLDGAICPIGDALSQASTYNAQIWVTPNSLVTGPARPATFPITIFNLTKTMKVYDLSVIGVPPGVTSQFNLPSVSLGPVGSVSDESQSITLTLTPGAAFTTPFTFNVVATPEGAPEFAISAPGSLLVRPQTVSVDSVSASPAYGAAGTKFTVTARVFAEVNEDQLIYLQVNVLNAGGQSVFSAYSPQFTLTTTASLQTITIATIDSTRFANGPYTLAVTAFYGSAPIPGATAAGSLLVGAPLSGTLTANAGSTPPGTVPPGTSAVQVALNIARDSITNPVSTLVGSVSLSGVSKTMVLYPNPPNQQLAYACSDAYVNIVDVTVPANPQVLGTFAHDVLTTESGSTVAGFQVVSCAIYNNNLILSYSRFDGNTAASPIPTHFATYSLTNPLHPVQVGSVLDISRSDSAGLYVAGNTALMFQDDIVYDRFSNFIQHQFGDLWVADLTSAGTNGKVYMLNDVFPCGGINGVTGACNNATNVPAGSVVNGACVVSGTTPIANDADKGGPYRIFAGTVVNAATSYFASTNSYNANLESSACPPVIGQLLVVNTTVPGAPAIASRVNDPAMAFMTSIAIQGNTAVAVGDSTGVTNAVSGFVGTLVISSFDITNPTSPVLLNSVVTQLTDQPGAFIVALGNNTFAVGNTSNGGKPELVLVDASTPTALRYIPYDAAFVASPAIAQNGYFFALSATPASTINALSVFKLSQIAGPQLTVKLQLPTTNCQNNTFNPAASSCTAGATSDTYQWDQPAQNTIAFSVNVTGVNPGDAPTVVTGGELDFTLPSLGSGKIVLGPLTVLCQQILSISPDGQNVSNAGDSAAFVVTVANPTTSPQTYVPSTIGIPASWGVQLPASVTVPPGGVLSFNLVLTTALNTKSSPAVYTFFVEVDTAGGITATVGSALGVLAAPITGGNPSAGFFNFTAALSPSQITVGQNGTGTFQVVVTNTGNLAGQATVLTPANLPGSWAISYSPSDSPVVLPGLANTQTVIGTIAMPPTFAPGAYQLIVPVQSDTTTVNLTLTVNVVSNGVTGSVSPNPGPSTGNFALNLQNLGTAQDTFNLSVVGPLSQVASIASSSGPIAPQGAAQIPITLNPVTFLVAGSYPLQIKAVSQGNPLVLTIIAGMVQVTGTKSVTASINPSPASVLNTPGSVSLLLHATNTGTMNDTYTASITGTTGPVTATLGGSSQIFAVPALGSAALPLTAQLTDAGDATVTVTVTSNSDGTVTSQATVTINNGTPAPPAPQVTPTQANVPVNRLALLDASASTDPGNLPLTFNWTVTSAPAGSAVNSASINLSSSAIAAVRPDVLGAYVFDVNVSNGTASADATIAYTAVDAAPVAVAGNPFNALAGAFVFLNGANSYDPDGQPIAFAWTLLSPPPGSNVTAGSIYNTQTPRPFFTPDIAGPYQFQLIVTDATAASQPATVTVTVYGSLSPPNADAGLDQNAVLNAPVTVNGSASADPNGSPLPLHYQWSLATVPGGSVASLNNATSASAQFTPDLAGDYVLNLVASNAHGVSPTASTAVHVFSGDVPPNANSGGNQFVPPNGAVYLNAQASSDPDNGPLGPAFLWWLNSLPANSGAALQNPLTATPHFVADKSGYYVGRVEDADGLRSGFSNTVVVSAIACDADANGVINQTDLALIAAAVGQTAQANDPRDANHDGQITSSDVAACSLIAGNTPTLQIAPPSFSESLIQGSPAVKQTLQLASSGSPISFMIASNQTWLTANIAAGSTATVSSVTAQVDPAGLTPAIYHGALTFTPTAGSAQTVGVLLTVSASTGNKCDVNQDGAVNVADVQRIIDEALGVTTATHDLNKDGVVNIVDVQIVINAALGLGCAAK